jgi:hypothetical protein
LVIDAYLNGHSTTSAITKHLGLSAPDAEQSVRSLLASPEFLREAEKARDAVEDRVVKWFKSRGLAYAQRMHDLSQNSDPRVAFQATKDALDRMGASATHKLAGSALDAYKALLQELQPDPVTKEESDGRKDEVQLQPQGTAGGGGEGQARGV